MTIFEVGAAFRTWSARQGMAPTSAAAHVVDANVSQGQIDAFDQTFGALEAPIVRAINARKVHVVAANESDSTILVYLNRGFTGKQIDKLPAEFGGYAVEYRHGVIGQVGGTPPSGLGSPSHYLHNGRITCGSSIGLGGSMGAGTLGALLRAPSGLLGLSNNHVIGRCSYAETGHPVLSPGNLDINPNFLIHPFTVGVYESSAPMIFGTPGTVAAAGNLDAAFMRIVDEAKVSAMQGQSYVTPAVIAPIADNMLVEKVGRTTGHTHGKVTGKIAGFQSVAYTVPELQQQFSVYFSDAWVVEGNPGAGPFSDRGDSGSLVVTTLPSGERAAIGLVFAGDGSISLIVPLAPILNHFHATLESAHGV